MEEEIEIVKSCALTDNDGDGVASLSDEITCGTETFHVMNNDGTNITMLSKYNLDLTTNLQSETNSGTTSFSLSVASLYGGPYWMIDDYYSVFVNNYVYGNYKDTDDNQQNLVYPYVEAYETNLKSKGISSATAELVSYDQVETAAIEDIDGASWLYTSSYWTGTAYVEDLNKVYVIDNNRGLQPKSFLESYGVRPLVIISKNEI